MRILDVEANKRLENICLYLTNKEAKELVATIQSLLNGDIEHHAHVNDDIYQHEITVTIYDEKNLEGFNARSKKLIKENE